MRAAASPRHGPGRPGRWAGAFGLAIAAVHAAGFAVLAGRCRGAELAVTADGAVPPALAHRVETATEGDAPGLVRRTWTVRYRGGFARTVGVAALVGPFQDPAARPCTGRVAVSQRLLDDGHASPGTVAAELGKALEAELAGERFVGVGSFRRVADVSVRWAEIARHPMDMLLVGAAPHGYVRATARLVFDRIDVPLVIALAPRPGAAELRFDIAVRAELALGNRVLQWISDRLGGDAFATRLAQRQVDEGLVAVLQPPPPLELPGGGTIAFGYCSDPPEIVDGAWGALPFAVELGRAPGAPEVLPPRRGRAPRTPPADTAELAIDLDLDALNALLFELWRTGFLDRRLAEAGLDRRFNEDPLVAELLSIRISPPRLALPPVVAPTARGLRLLADARVAIADGAQTTTGRVWGGLDFAFAERVGEPVSVELGALELSCERPPATLVPCYADLVAAVRDRGDAFQGELTRVFAGLLAEIFAGRRLEEPGLPAALVIHAAAPRLTTAPPGAASDAGSNAGSNAAPNASLHLDLNAVLVPPR
ncbi:MAG TPA: hypothetical protein VK932_03865 [Kofleriaceae bacterium]|nr:hypothetical protein [Kofleriaceae bacterium]